MNLQELYQLKLENNDTSNYAKLLALLLLPNIKDYEPVRSNPHSFYEKYKEKINEKISQVEKDFKITDEDYNNVFIMRGFESDNIDFDKIWTIYSEGFGALQWGLIYANNKSPEQIYEFFFDEDLNTKKTKGR